MHISEGVLSLPVLAAGYAVSSVGVGVGLHKMSDQDVVKTAVFAAAFFVAALIHVPLGPGHLHLVLNGLLGIFLGWSCWCAIVVALTLQALLFHFGGFTSLGVNVLNMAGPALLVYYLFKPWLRNQRAPVFVIGFLAGSFAVLFSALGLCSALVLSGEQFVSSARLIFMANLPLMLVEGFVSGSVLSFIAKVKPEMLSC
jgi:cobalt/nickel transport system permease protein